MTNHQENLKTKTKQKNKFCFASHLLGPLMGHWPVGIPQYPITYFFLFCYHPHRCQIGVTCILWRNRQVFETEGSSWNHHVCLSAYFSILHQSVRWNWGLCSDKLWNLDLRTEESSFTRVPLAGHKREHVFQVDDLNEVMCLRVTPHLKRLICLLTFKLPGPYSGNVIFTKYKSPCM